jgi:hypothetical protein
MRFSPHERLPSKSWPRAGGAAHPAPVSQKPSCLLKFDYQVACEHQVPAGVGQVSIAIRSIEFGAICIGHLPKIAVAKACRRYFVPRQARHTQRRACRRLSAAPARRMVSSSGRCPVDAISASFASLQTSYIECFVGRDDPPRTRREIVFSPDAPMKGARYNRAKGIDSAAK